MELNPGGKEYYVYILCDRKKRLETGLTKNFIFFLNKHKDRDSLKLVYYETRKSKRAALLREKRIKCLVRKQKKKLVESVNPDWLDVSSMLLENLI
jgi:putative endonuclease